MTFDPAALGIPQGAMARLAELRPDRPGHIFTSDLTVNDLHELLGQDFGPAMMWLCAGMVATVGAGDVDWLRGIDATENEEG